MRRAPRAGRSTLAQVVWLLCAAIALLLLVAGLLLRTQGIAGGLAQVGPLVLAQHHLLQRWLERVPPAAVRTDPALQALGLELRDAPPEVPDQSPYPFQRALAAHLRERLGSDRVRLEEGPPLRLWLAIDAPDRQRLWMAIGLPMQMERVRDSALLWLAGAALVIGATATRIATRLTRPLRTLATHAPALVQGEPVDPAPLRGAPDEVQALAAALASAGEAQRRNARERDLMLAGLSHDLRSPLARLRFAIELGDHGGAIADGHAAMVADVEELDALLAQFIAFARGGGTAEPAVDIDPATLQSTLKSSRRSPDAWQWWRDPALPALRLPLLGLRRAIANLLDNAERHGAAPYSCAFGMPPAGTDPRPQWRITVRDHGPGLSADQIEALRQPFQRGDPARSGPGSGLGLAIVDRFAAEQGGRLLLGAAEDGLPGLCATLELPLLAAGGVDAGSPDRN